MGVVGGCVAPHPPIIVQEVGGAETRRVSSTIEAMHDVAKRLAANEPDSLVIMSPHSPMLPSAVPVRTDSTLRGSFKAFRAPQVKFDLATDEDLVAAILSESQARGLPVQAIDTSDAFAFTSMYGPELDHGVLVPLYFLREALDVPIVNLGLSFQPYGTHYRIGTAIDSASESIGRRTVFVASGDLSHRLTPEAPAGHSPLGRELDAAIVEALRTDDFLGLRAIDPDLIEAGGECGLRSIITLTGCFADRDASCDVLSYEGPFGVGYLVAHMRAT